MSISWFKLERYKLGELPPEEAAEVEQALKHDPKARARLREMDSPLPRRTPWFLAAAAASVAAIAMWQFSDDGVRVKGDTLTLSIVRESSGGATRLRAGERYSLQVTCVPPRDLSVAVRVTQDGTTEDPFGENQTVHCANEVPLPKALVFDSPSEALVCVFAADKKSCITLR